jgi:hypothetical protein
MPNWAPTIVSARTNKRHHHHDDDAFYLFLQKQQIAYRHIPIIAARADGCAISATPFHIDDDAFYLFLQKQQPFCRSQASRRVLTPPRLADPAQIR